MVSKVVILKIFDANSGENFVKKATFPFQCVHKSESIIEHTACILRARSSAVRCNVRLENPLIIYHYRHAPILEDIKKNIFILLSFPKTEMAQVVIMMPREIQEHAYATKPMP